MTDIVAQCRSGACHSHLKSRLVRFLPSWPRVLIDRDDEVVDHVTRAGANRVDRVEQSTPRISPRVDFHTLKFDGTLAFSGLLKLCLNISFYFFLLQ